MRNFLLRRMFCLVAAVGLMLAFSACSDDDNEDDLQGNGEGAGNGGSGVTVLAKKVSKIVESGLGESTMTYLFSYDSEGRLSKIFRGENDVYREYQYETNKISVYRNNKLVGEITLSNGKAVSDRQVYGTYAYTYSGNYIAGIQEVCYDGDGVQESFYTTTLVVKDKNWVAANTVTDDPIDNINIVLEPSEVANSMNIDIFYGWIFGEEDSWLLCVLGSRFQNLPAKVTYSGNKENWDGSMEPIVIESTYTYEVDEDNYVTKVTEKEKEDDDEIEVKVYTITYE